jgi:hypothetical protein
VQAQRDALKQQQELLQQLQHFQHGRQPPTNQPAAALSWHNLAGDTSAHGAAGAVAPVTPAAATGVGDAVKFSKALTAAESDRRAALKQAAAAQGETRQLRQQLEQQEQELHHLRRWGCDTGLQLPLTDACKQSSCWRSANSWAHHASTKATALFATMCARMTHLVLVHVTGKKCMKPGTTYYES